MTNLRSDLAAHGEHVGSGHGHGVAPERAIFFDVYRFQGDLQLLAFFEVVAGDYVTDVHGEARLLGVHAGRIIFAGGGEGPDGKRADVAEGVGNFIGDGQAQEIEIFFAAEVLQWENGDGALAGRNGGVQLRRASAQK